MTNEATTVLESLEFLSQELIRQQFLLQRIKRDQKTLEKQKQSVLARIMEIKRRADYNLDKHSKIIGELD